VIVFSFATPRRSWKTPAAGLAAYLTIFGLVFADAIVATRIDG
jgi:hypothetical protein